MDTIEKYKSAVKSVLHEVMPSDATLPIQTVLIEDDIRGHYLLYHDGWKGERHIYGCFLHIEIKQNGKVWLQYDGTDMIVGEMLLEAGIPEKDIALGFNSPIVRTDTGFAVV